MSSQSRRDRDGVHLFISQKHTECRSVSDEALFRGGRDGDAEERQMR